VGDCKIATVKEANSEPERTRKEQNSQSLECFVQGSFRGSSPIERTGTRARRQDGAECIMEELTRNSQ